MRVLAIVLSAVSMTACDLDSTNDTRCGVLTIRVITPFEFDCPRGPGPRTQLLDKDGRVILDRVYSWSVSPNLDRMVATDGGRLLMLDPTAGSVVATHSLGEVGDLRQGRWSTDGTTFSFSAGQWLNRIDSQGKMEEGKGSRD